MNGRGLLAACAATVVLAIAPAAAAAEPRIIGGSVAPAGAYPWVAALVESDQQNAFVGQFCGGSLIGPTTVLTAAHCVEDQLPGDFEVVLGRSRLSSSTEGERIAVTGYAMEPGYLDERFTDFALLRLAQPSAQTPVALAGADDVAALAPGSLVRALGWGLIRNGGRDGSDDLREVDVPLVSDGDCNAAYEEDGGTFEEANYLCAGAEGIDTCSGDSGGPLIVGDASAPRILGVTSYGRECAQAGFPGVYSDVPAFSGFITNPEPVFAPAPSETRARVVGSPRIGNQLTCSAGTWAGENIRFKYVWYRPARRTVGREETFTPTAKQAGKRIGCSIIASNGGGEVILAGRAVEIRR